MWLPRGLSLGLAHAGQVGGAWGGGVRPHDPAGGERAGTNPRDDQHQGEGYRHPGGPAA